MSWRLEEYRSRTVPKKQNAKLTGMDGPLLHGILGAVAIVEGDIGGDLFPKVVAIEPPVGEEHRCWCRR